MSLEIEGLTVEGEAGFSLRIPVWVVGEGDIATLVGPQGAGKTLLLETIAGFVRPVAGDIRVGGRSVVGLPVEHRNIAVLFARDGLFPHMTVFRNLCFVVPRPRLARRWLSLADLEPLADLYPRQLNPLDRRRVELIRALASRPRLILIDEPTADIPEESKEQWRSFAGSWLRETRVTAVAAVSNVEEAFRWSNRLALLWKGRLVQEGTTEDVWNRPASPEVAAILGGGRVFRGQVVQRNHSWMLVRLYPGQGAVDLMIWSNWLYREWEDVWVYIPESAWKVWPRGEGEAAAASPNRFPGSIGRIRMHPGGVLVEVNTDPLTVTALIPHRDWAGAAFTEGEPVWLSIDPSDPQLIRATQ
ncbi:MAG: ABC transporter ATP-binding protein [Kyrpidia tusciae]|nr:ABC transporter ATP-binding protein [Kyrpidia tusciae]MBE3552011.1 ABC transporter ATP-binding protein [Kyrpidia tusciae]